MQPSLAINSHSRPQLSPQERFTHLSELALRRRNLLLLSPGSTPAEGVCRFLTDIAGLGYAVNPVDVERLKNADPGALWVFTQSAQALTGAAAGNFQTLHQDFAHVVPTMTDSELYGSALLHYLAASFGDDWRPQSAAPMLSALTGKRFRQLGIATEQDFREIASWLLGSSQPFSDTDETDLWALEYFITDSVEVPIRENLALLCAHSFASQPWHHQLKTTTDVLRVACELSGGDRSLTVPTRFRLRRPYRRTVVQYLERVLSRGDFDRHLEDMMHYDERWKRLLHCLHVQEFPKATKTHLVRQLIHETGLPNTPAPPVSRERRIELLIEAADIGGLVTELQTNPGDFARRLHALTRKLPEHRAELVAAFQEIAPQVAARVLVQMWNFFHSAPESSMPFRVVLTKQGASRATFIRNTLSGDYSDIIAAVESGLSGRLAGRKFAVESSVDHAAELLTVPLGIRAASSGTRSLGRGSRINIGDRPWVRLFLHWRDIAGHSTDVDLSAYFVGENFESKGKVAYTNLREPNLGAYHSGDVVRAPQGAAEYIDINMEAARAAGVRYVVVMGYAFSRTYFRNIPEAAIGIMTRQDPVSGQHFEASEVVVRSDLTAESFAATPAVLDLWRQQLVWVDWTVQVDDSRPINLESSESELQILVQAVEGDAHMSIGDFLRLCGADTSSEDEIEREVIDPMNFEAVTALIDC